MYFNVWEEDMQTRMVIAPWSKVQGDLLILWISKSAGMVRISLCSGAFKAEGGQWGRAEANCQPALSWHSTCLHRITPRGSHPLKSSQKTKESIKHVHLKHMKTRGNPWQPKSCHDCGVLLSPIQAIKQVFSSLKWRHSNSLHKGTKARQIESKHLY